MNKKKKFTFKDLNHYQIKNLIALLICFSFITSLSIGYAVLNQKLKLEGTVSLRAENTIKIIGFSDFLSTSGGYEQYNPTHDKESITANITLPEITSTVSYTILIYNNTDSAMDIKKIIEESYSNPLISYNFDNLKVNDTIEKGQKLTTTITFSYSPTITSVPENQSLGINIKFQFEKHIPNEYEFVYQANYNKYVITKYTGAMTTLVIPTTYNDLDIITIDKYAFQNKNLTDVVLPERLENIIFSSFQSNNLNSLIFPETIKSIGNEAFFRNQLEIISFRGKTPPTISSSAFSYNFKLKTVCIPTTADKEIWKNTLDKVLTNTQ